MMQALIAICFLAHGAHAQLHPLVVQVEQAINSKEPGWREMRGVLTAPPPTIKSEKPILVSTWEKGPEKSPSEKIDLTIYEYGSIADAQNSQRTAKFVGGNGWGVKLRDQPKMGEDAFLVSSPWGFTLRFRRKAIVVSVRGASLPAVKRFAKNVAGTIDAI